MTPSSNIKAFMRSYETCRLVAYMPTPNDRPTIGWGHAGPEVRMGLRWTQEQADAQFAKDLDQFASDVLHALHGAPTTQNQFDAMVSLAFNIGSGNFYSSTLLKKHIAKDYEGVANEFVRWNKQKGVVLDGLTKRRAAEAKIYKEGF